MSLIGNKRVPVSPQEAQGSPVKTKNGHAAMQMEMENDEVKANFDNVLLAMVLGIL